MRISCENPGAPVMRRRADPEREKRTGELLRNDPPLIAVAGSSQTAAWLSAIVRSSRLPWTVTEGETSPGLLVLVREEDAPPRLPSRLVVSLDSPECRKLAARSDVKSFTFSESRDAADLTAKDLRLTARGLSFLAVTRSAIARVAVGKEALYPALAALSCAVWLGVPLEQAAKTVSENPL